MRGTACDVLMGASAPVGLPVGVVTLLFSDIEGSTRLLQELGDVYGDVLSDHHRLLREAWLVHDGVEVDTEGDAFLVVFRAAPDAIAAAAEVQQQLESGPIRVRVGIHTGTPLLGDEGYVGADVHKGARIAAAAHGGQVILSRETRDLLLADAELLAKTLVEMAQGQYDDRIRKRLAVRMQAQLRARVNMLPDFGPQTADQAPPDPPQDRSQPGEAGPQPPEDPGPEDYYGDAFKAGR